MSTTWRNYIRSLLLSSNVICYNRLDLVHATATWLTKAADIHSEYVTQCYVYTCIVSLVCIMPYTFRTLFFFFFFFFALWIVLQLRNINQRNVHFSNWCFNSIFDVFYMFRKSWVHYQEDSLYTQCLYGFVCFSPDCLHKWMKNILYSNCVYKLSSWWWTHEVRNMQKTSKIELKH